MRTVKAAGFDVDKAFAKAISTDDNEVMYRRESIYGVIQVGEARWKVMVAYCPGGGSTIGAKAKALERMGDTFPMMNLYIGGHTHLALSFPSDRMDISTNSGGENVTRITRHFSGCGSTLEYLGSYAEEAQYPPASLCQVVHYLGNRIHRTHRGVNHYEMPFKRDLVML